MLKVKCKTLGFTKFILSLGCPSVQIKLTFYINLSSKSSSRNLKISYLDRNYLIIENYVFKRSHLVNESFPLDVY